MKLLERIGTAARVLTGMKCNSALDEAVKVHRAAGHIQHIRNGKLIWEETVYNVKTTAGIDYTFNQTYNSSASGQTTGLSWVGLSASALTETVASTTLLNEITTNGLSRAQGVYAHVAGASTATIAETFTCTTAPQAAQKAALFSASSAGTMHHVLAFTLRSLQVGDQLAVTFTITLT